MKVRNAGHGNRTCLDAHGGKKGLRKPVSLYSCHRQGGNQVIKLLSMCCRLVAKIISRNFNTFLCSCSVVACFNFIVRILFLLLVCELCLHRNLDTSTVELLIGINLINFLTKFYTKISLNNHFRVYRLEIMLPICVLIRR